MRANQPMRGVEWYAESNRRKDAQVVMKYLSANEMAEVLGTSKSMVRKYCAQGRMPGAEKVNGEWMIPASLDKPEAETSSPVKAEKLPPIGPKDKEPEKTQKLPWPVRLYSDQRYLQLQPHGQ